MKTVSRRPTAQFLTALCFSAACSMPSDSMDGESSHESSSPEMSKKDDDPSVCEPYPLPRDEQVLRRLTPRQYQNTLRDWFPYLDLSTLSFPDSHRGASFDHLSQAQRVSPLSVYLDDENAWAVAAQVLAKDPDIEKCKNGSEAAFLSCFQDLLVEWAAGLFRRPLTADEAMKFRSLTTRFTDEGFADVAAESMLAYLFQHPAWMYVDESALRLPKKMQNLSEPDSIDAFVLATRLALWFWDSGPDAELLRAASAGQLRTAVRFEEQITRMLEDSRAERGILNFARQAFELDEVEAMASKSIEIPEFTEELRDAMLKEMRALSLRALRDGSLHQLLVGQESMIPTELFEIYGVDENGSENQWTSLDGDVRVGLLTTPGFLASHALHERPSPVQRGRFILEKFQCQSIPVPDADLMASDAETLDPTLSNREWFEVHARDPVCSSCHNLMDPIGFAFEAYDGIGRFVDEVAGETIDDRGWIELDGVEHSFRGAAQLSAHLAASDDVKDCIADQWLQYALGREILESDGCSQNKVREAFRESDGSFRALYVAIASSAAFHRPTARSLDE